MPEIFLDTCVLSNFSLSGHFSLLLELYPGQAAVTDFVAAEITRGIHLGHEGLKPVREAIRAGKIKERHVSGDEETALFESLSVSLGLGEASCIAAAKGRGSTFASDDRAARREAAHLGIPLTGTLGILKKAVSRKVLTGRKADKILDQMKEIGFFSNIRSLEEI